MRKKISDIVEENPGIKVTELVTKFPQETIQKGFCVKTLMKLIEDMMRTGEIVSVSYVTTRMDYREKTILFPKGTKVCINSFI
jgi:hypothetical protein